ncbi:MAG: thiosulfate oxidation carrier protein SoxY [Burkholderiales bacterium]|nr:MAG: thiosulfate oxidation carrier protein SoxY [Burkholderiales bacterium]
MNRNRRQTLQAAGGVGLYGALVAMGLGQPMSAAAQTGRGPGFDAKTIPEALEQLGASNAAQSDAIVIDAPDIAENGAVVPVAIESKIPNTEYVALLVEKNARMLAGSFTLTPAVESMVSMRIKMGQSSEVVALVKADGKFYMTKKEIKVTLGGCGG